VTAARFATASMTTCTASASAGNRPSSAIGGLEADDIRYFLPTGIVESHLHRLAGCQIEERDIWPAGEKARTARNPILPNSPVRLTDKVHRDAVERDNRAGIDAPRRLHGEVRVGRGPLPKSGICKAGRQEHGNGCDRLAHTEITPRAGNSLRARLCQDQKKSRRAEALRGCQCCEDERRAGGNYRWNRSAIG